MLSLVRVVHRRKVISFCIPLTVNECLLRLIAANTQLDYFTFTLNVNLELNYAAQSVKEDNSHPITDLYKSIFCPQHTSFPFLRG